MSTFNADTNNRTLNLLNLHVKARETTGIPRPACEGIVISQHRAGFVTLMDGGGQIHEVPLWRCTFSDVAAATAQIKETP